MKTTPALKPKFKKKFPLASASNFYIFGREEERKNSLKGQIALLMYAIHHKVVRQRAMESLEY